MMVEVCIYKIYIWITIEILLGISNLIVVPFVAQICYAIYYRS